MERRKILVISDVHYASAGEQARPGHEVNIVRNPLGRFLLRCYRDHVWLRDPYHKNYLLDKCLETAPPADLLIGNGDFTLDTAFVGISDEAACQSARECLEKMRARYGTRLHCIPGDHELGKFSMVGRRGGPRLASWRRLRTELGMEPFWKVELGGYLLLGVASSALAYPLFEHEMLPEEQPAWERISSEHFEQVRAAFACLRPGQRVILFCHDPSALPFLWRDETVRGKIAHVELTVIGHLHSPFILWKSRLLSGMPAVRWCGNTVRRYSSALREARLWKPFHVQLCPSLAGLELFKDGGYLLLHLDPEGRSRVEVERRHLAR